MISQKKAADIERAYRKLLYARPFGILSVLFFIGIVTFSIGGALSSTKVNFPFFAVYTGSFSLLIIAVALFWLLQAFALLRKKDWSGLIMVPLGLGAAYFGIGLFISAITEFHWR